MQTLGLLIVIALGMLGIGFPNTVARFVRISALGQTGLSEIRATYGGLFLGMGIFGLWSSDPQIATTIGIGFGCAALARASSALLEKSRGADNFAGIALEGFIAALLLI